LKQEAAIDGIKLKIYDDPTKIADRWLEFEKSAVCSLYQSFYWIETWCRFAASHYGEQPLIILGEHSNGEIAFIWPMAITRCFGISVLSWLGQTYAGYNLGLYRPDIMAMVGEKELKRFLKEIKLHRPELAAVNFYHQPLEWEGITNPFSLLPSVPTYENSYMLKLPDNFDIFYKTVVSRKIRQVQRRNEKRLRESGNFIMDRAKTSEQRLEIHEIFLQQKTLQLKNIGIYNVYRNPGLRQFTKNLVTNRAGAFPFDYFFTLLDDK